jgi:hypothetical protein
MENRWQDLYQILSTSDKGIHLDPFTEQFVWLSLESFSLVRHS